jgi:hypothetical protein
MLKNVVTAEVSRRVLRAISESYPDAGVIMGIEIAQGWGEAVQVDIRHGPEQRSGSTCESGQLDQLRTAVCSALEPWRHTVRTIEIAH